MKGLLERLFPDEYGQPAIVRSAEAFSPITTEEAQKNYTEFLGKACDAARLAIAQGDEAIDYKES